MNQLTREVIAPDHKAVTAKVEDAINLYVKQKIREAEKVGTGYVELWQEIDTYLNGGGKRMRPYLAFFAYYAYGGNDEQTILPLACAWELLHACLLIHDDIIDRDLVRHNLPNIAGRYQKRYQKLSSKDFPHYALSAALLAGDLLLSSSYDIVNSSSLNAQQKVLAQTYLQSAFFAVGGGEHIDVESALYSISKNDPISVAHYKTATYSFQLPLLCGARIAGAPESELEILEKVGLQAGIAFQLRDDLLGIFGEEEKTGKSNRTDIHEKKRTLLILLTLQELNPKQATRLEELYNTNHVMSQSEVEEIVGLIEVSGAKELVEAEIFKRAQNAQELVTNLKIDQAYVAVLIKLLEKLTTRNS